VSEIDIANAFQSISDQLENEAFDVEIIYYSAAIEYLSENDPSLQESMSIASEMGFTTENLNSELLASLLASQNCREEWQELETEISNFFKELGTEIEELEEE